MTIQFVGVVAAALAMVCSTFPVPHHGRYVPPHGYSVPQMTRSPDGRYGVLVPDSDQYNWNEEQNELVDLQTGRVLATIHAHSGAVHANHVDLVPALWSRDDSLLLWRVDGKWIPTALVVLKLRHGRVLWQLNILQTAQRAILQRTRRASLARYRAAMHENRRSGAAFPDGFTVPVSVATPSVPLSLPLKVTASLTSNPKEIDSYPKGAELNSELRGVVTSGGTFRVTRFALTTATRHGQ